MKRREAGLQQEVNEYTERIDEVEQKLQEEQVKLKQAEERFQSMELEQQEYRAFRQQINGIYNDALGQFTRKNYSRGIERLKAIPPILRSAKEKGIGDSIELKVEEDLVNNILYLAEREQNRLDLDSIGQKTLEAAILLEKEGKTKEALSRYFTVYTVSNDDEYKKTALERADVLMDRLFRERNIQERRELVKKADVLFNNAMVHKQKGEFEQAMGNLEEIIKLAETPRSKKTLEEIISIDRLWANSEEEKENRMINQKTSAIVKDAKKSYDDGYYADALAKYEDVIKNYKTSKHSEQALSEIIRINEEMRGLKITPPRSFKEGESDSGVIIQVISGGTMLFNLGSDNNINQGDVLQVYRKEENEFTFIGTLKVYDVFPRLSRGKIVYSDKQFKIGDVVAF
jgi:tetratricopeptide (TPR) repeat protein